MLRSGCRGWVELHDVRQEAEMARVRIYHGVGTWVSHRSMGGRMLIVDIEPGTGRVIVAWLGNDGQIWEGRTRQRDLTLAR